MSQSLPQHVAWFWRFIYDREAASWERRRDEREHHDPVERTVAELVILGKVSI